MKFKLIIIIMIILLSNFVTATSIISKDTWKQGNPEIITFQSKANVHLVQLRIKDVNGDLIYVNENLTKTSNDRWSQEIKIPSNYNSDKIYADFKFYAGVNEYSLSKEIEIEKMKFREKIILFVKTNFNFKFIIDLIDKARKNLNIS